MLIRPCRQIHTFLMRLDIDVLFLTETGDVVHMIRSMKRNRISPFIRECTQVLEMDQGAIDRYGIQVGDALALEQTN